jgi:hypothetical protein
MQTTNYLKACVTLGNALSAARYYGIAGVKRALDNAMIRVTDTPATADERQITDYARMMVRELSLKLPEEYSWLRN